MNLERVDQFTRACGLPAKPRILQGLHGRAVDHQGHVLRLTVQIALLFALLNILRDSAEAFSVHNLPDTG